ncbi:MAG: hypothetical protein OEW64_14155 [Gammaproteobacteria bacterium]|nr:hypothetical protein [Gammaproteobacteria bacterium]MDH5323328.1 hypothetical protein [Gammaproteobacteria bacterium]
MDKLAQQLREDANSIEVDVSPQLDARIRASLAGVRQETGRTSSGSTGRAPFWWASSLTGIAATVAIISVINLGEPDPEPAITQPPPQQFTMPQFTFKPKAAILTESLQQELDAIQSDLKKAEQVIKDDFDKIGI